MGNLSSAKQNADLNVETAANRAYYACFYAAQAALLTAGVSAKTHTGVHNQFRELSVVTGKMPAETARILIRSFHLRLTADYEAESALDAGAVAATFNEVEAFIQAIEQVLT